MYVLIRNKIFKLKIYLTLSSKLKIYLIFSNLLYVVLLYKSVLIKSDLIRLNII